MEHIGILKIIILCFSMVRREDVIEDTTANNIPSDTIIMDITLNTVIGVVVRPRDPHYGSSYLQSNNK